VAIAKYVALTRRCAGGGGWITHFDFFVKLGLLNLCETIKKKKNDEQQLRFKAKLRGSNNESYW